MAELDKNLLELDINLDLIYYLKSSLSKIITLKAGLLHKNSEVLKVESLETQLLSKYFKDCQRNTTSLAGKTFSRRTLLLLFFWLGGLCAGTSGNRTRPRRSRGAVQEKTECIHM